MKAQNYMTETVLYITPSQSVLEAYELMFEHNIRHLPVVTNGKVIGVISDRDILAAGEIEEDEIEIEGLLAMDIMSPNPICCYLDTPIWEVAAMMTSLGVNSIIVTGPEKNLLGIITSTDLLRFVENKGFWLEMMKSKNDHQVLSF